MSDLYSHGNLLDIDGWNTPDNISARYGDVTELRDLILHKRVVKVSEHEVELENGIVLTIECSESDCCAYGEGKFEFDEYNVPLEAVITDFKIHEPVDVPCDHTVVRRNTITLFHNQNPIINANAETDAGNGGYYYSITSLVIGRVCFPFVDAY